MNTDTLLAIECIAPGLMLSKSMIKHPFVWLNGSASRKIGVEVW